MMELITSGRTCDQCITDCGRDVMYRFDGSERHYCERCLRKMAVTERFSKNSAMLLEFVKRCLPDVRTRY
jgi:hypothetical protein